MRNTFFLFGLKAMRYSDIFGYYKYDKPLSISCDCIFL